MCGFTVVNEIYTAIGEVYKNSICDHVYAGYDMRELARCKVCYAFLKVLKLSALT